MKQQPAQRRASRLIGKPEGSLGDAQEKVSRGILGLPIEGCGPAQQRADALLERVTGKRPLDAQDQVQDHGRRRLTDTE